MSVLFWSGDVTWPEDVLDRKSWQIRPPGQRYKKKPDPVPFGSWFWKTCPIGMARGSTVNTLNIRKEWHSRQRREKRRPS